MEDGIICSQFIFYNNFDSANLARVEFVPQNESSVSKHSATNKSVVPEIPDAEFNVWTKPDCFGTEFENGNRTWFYFGMKAPEASLLVRINMIDLNRQGKMYSQGMAPVYRILPLKPQWERVKEKPAYNLSDDIFTVSFKYRTPESTQHITYFAFTYPFSFTELEKMLINIDEKYLTRQPVSEDDVYYARECVCTSLEGRPIDLITISSYHGITNEREPRLKNLFSDKNVPRPYKFGGKKVIFISARVHPGETPSSFVFNGLLSLLLARDDLVAITLRRLYVFKLIPFLNPDGVANGHYRTDTRGVNLNRVYRNPSLSEHPSVYAARSLLRYYHFGCEKDDQVDKCDNCTVQNDNISQQVLHMSLDEEKRWCWRCKNGFTNETGLSAIIPSTTNVSTLIGRDFCRNCGSKIEHDEPEEQVQVQSVTSHGDVNCNESGLFLYCDLHGHASKKGIFMYGNHFDDVERGVECMLLAKLMSINNHNFHFNACNFTERNMYLKDKRDGMSRAGSGRVAVLSLTGIVRSYTLECNYNSGRMVNVLPPTVKENNSKVHTLPVPPKYTPQIYEEVGKSLCHSILDLTGQNPYSRLPNSEFHSLNGLRDWLRLNCMNEIGLNSAKTATNKVKVKKSSSLQSQGKSTRGMVIKTRPSLVKTVTKKIYRQSAAAAPTKEIFPTTTTSPTTPSGPSAVIMQPQQPSCSYSTSKSSIRLNKCFTLKSKMNTTRSKAKLTPQKVRLDMTTAKGRQKEEKVDDKPSDSIVELREICFIKSSEGKKVVAKYKNKDGDSIDEKLVVAWDASNANPQIYTQKGRIVSAPIGKSLSEPGTSKQQGIFRVHNFARTTNYSKTKLKKHALRLLSSASESVSKVDKKKKKKLKAK